MAETLTALEGANRDGIRQVEDPSQRRLDRLRDGAPGSALEPAADSGESVSGTHGAARSLTSYARGIAGSRQRRTVLLAFHEDATGGATLAVLRLVPLLQERGWDFVFWAPRPSALFEHLVAEGYEVHGEPRLIRYSPRALRHPPGVGRRLTSLPRYASRLRGVIRSVSPDLFHANTILALPEALVARWTGTRTLLQVHEMLPGGMKGALARRLAHLAADEVVAVSAANAAPLVAGGLRPRIVYGASAIEPTRPRPATRNGRLVVGTVGEVSRRKGSDVFVEAARLVAERDDSIEFRLVGSRPEGPENEWAGRVIDEALAQGIRHEHRTDVARELPGWDIFVLPSRRDPFPSVVLEAMATGLPVIGSAVDGIPEQITPETGLVVPPGDPASLAAAILDLAADPDRREALGAAGQRRIRELFSLERQAGDLHDAYMAALSG